MIPVVTSGLYYGAGCFESFVAEEGRIFKFEDHIKRLHNGLKYLGASDVSMVHSEIVLDQIKKLLKQNDLLSERARIRIQVSLTEKGGYSRQNDTPAISIIESKSAAKSVRIKKLILSETSVVSSSARPTELKLSNMLHYRQAFREAEQKGADDAIMITNNGFVAESSIANIFWKKDNIVFTPSYDCDILPGIMRNSVIDILQQRRDFKVKEGRFSMDELLKADSVWLTNSVLEIDPVSDIENISFEIDEDLFSYLRNNLEAYKKSFSTHV